MAKEIHYSPDMVCPYCGNEEFFVRQSYRGVCDYNLRFDFKKDADNSEMFGNASFRTTSKYAYCNNCFKRLFKVSELPYNHR